MSLNHYQVKVTVEEWEPDDFPGEWTLTLEAKIDRNITLSFVASSPYALSKKDWDLLLCGKKPISFTMGGKGSIISTDDTYIFHSGDYSDAVVSFTLPRSAVIDPLTKALNTAKNQGWKFSEK